MIGAIVAISRKASCKASNQLIEYTFQFHSLWQKAFSFISFSLASSTLCHCMLDTLCAPPAQRGVMLSIIYPFLPCGYPVDFIKRYLWCISLFVVTHFAFTSTERSRDISRL